MSRNNKNKFRPRDDSEFERVRNTREQKNVKEDLPKIVFSFKDFDIKQIPPGQTYQEWQQNDLLAHMLEKFEAVCSLNVIEAQQQRLLKIYNDFPNNSDFNHSQHIVESVKWAVIMDIGGQKGRVAGHLIGNVFYVVFLDKEHRFYISEKKNT